MVKTLHGNVELCRSSQHIINTSRIKRHGTTSYLGMDLVQNGIVYIKYTSSYTKTADEL